MGIGYKEQSFCVIRKQTSFKKLDFLILLVTKYSMSKVIIINIPMMPHCVLHMQSMSLTSVASSVLICCIAMFVTKAFNFDCPYIIYTITNVMIIVISAAVNRSMSARKLLRNDLNSEFSFVLLKFSPILMELIEKWVDTLLIKLVLP